MASRKRGILCHISCLPSDYGVGDFGSEACRFIDQLHNAGMTHWQILPLNPTDVQTGNSPYTSISAFALNSLFLSLQRVVESGWIAEKEVKKYIIPKSDHVDYARVMQSKREILDVLVEKFETTDVAFQSFLEHNKYWLDDYALYCVIKKHNNDLPWFKWPAEYKNRDPETLRQCVETFKGDLLRIKLEQFVLDQQWQNVKNYANSKGISIIGDVPIYIDLDSSDIWSHRKYFKLNDEGERMVVGGVPPDYFSETGQLWGSPIYDWEALKEDCFAWWVERIKKSHSLFDCVRIDHFRGLVEYWEIPVEETSAVNGRWVKAPAEDLLNAIKGTLGVVPIIAEDLGVMSDDVARIMKAFDLPGMKVLQFAFDSTNDNPYLPHNYEHNCVVYTGTHDNNTTRGWFKADAKDYEKEHLARYANTELNVDNVAQTLISLAFGSPAQLAIVPVQDILDLGKEARLNVPGQELQNWEWKMQDLDRFSEQLQKYKVQPV